MREQRSFVNPAAVAEVVVIKLKFEAEVVVKMSWTKETTGWVVCE